MIYFVGLALRFPIVQNISIEKDRFLVLIVGFKQLIFALYYHPALRCSNFFIDNKIFVFPTLFDVDLL